MTHKHTLYKAKTTRKRFLHVKCCRRLEPAFVRVDSKQAFTLIVGKVPLDILAIRIGL